MAIREINKHNNINTMNVFILTIQSKMALMQQQVSTLSSTIDKLQREIADLSLELETVKTTKTSIPRVFEEYIRSDKQSYNDSHTLDPLEPITLEEYQRDCDQFVVIPYIDTTSEIDSNSECDIDEILK